ncbi:hypothetical protein A2U01_0092003, partial [Trifolium medium]|nr:hypothetical protein [Trifolium medium]
VHLVRLVLEKFFEILREPGSQVSLDLLPDLLISFMLSF